MRKAMAMIITVVAVITMTACSLPAGSQPVSSQNTEAVIVQPQVDQELLQLLENRVNTTQPGTAGSGLKAVYAAKDILAWAKENKPELSVVKATVKEFFENCEYSEEARWAFETIGYIFDVINDGKAEALLDSAGICMEDFKTNPDVWEYIEKLIEEIKEYIPQE